MHLNPFALVSIAVGFCAAVFMGVYFGGLGGDGATLASSLATTFGLVIFFGVFFATERMIDNADIRRRSEQFDSAKEHDRIRKSDRYRHRLDRIYNQRRTISDIVSDGIQRLFRIEGSRLQDLRLQLIAAGFYSERALPTYLLLVAAMPVLWLLVGGATGVLQQSEGTSVLLRMIIGALLGFYLVKRYISHRIDARREAMRLEMPDVIDLLVIYTESGVAFDSALKKVIEMIKKRCRVAATEMALLERELQLLPDRARAYENLVRRMDIPIVKNFASILLQSERIGSPISAAMRQMSAETRRERLMNAEQRAARIPVLIQLPILFLILPALLIVVLGPTILKVIAAWKGLH